jgi:hypothetical protein
MLPVTYDGYRAARARHGTPVPPRGPPAGGGGHLAPPGAARAPIGSLRPTIYSPAYFRQFRPGFQPILVGNVAYYYYSVLPPGATWVMHRGTGFYRAGGMWFQPHFTGGRRYSSPCPPVLSPGQADGPFAPRGRAGQEVPGAARWAERGETLAARKVIAAFCSKSRQPRRQEVG